MISGIYIFSKMLRGECVRYRILYGGVQMRRSGQMPSVCGSSTVEFYGGVLRCFSGLVFLIIIMCGAVEE